jgi:hypothetical protein
MVKRTKLTRPPSKTVPARVVPGKRRWMLVTCPRGHLIRQVPYGNWTDARRKYEGATVQCTRCADD